MSRFAIPVSAAVRCLLAFPASAFEPVAILIGLAVAPDGDDLAIDTAIRHGGCSVLRYPKQRPALSASESK